MKLVRKMIVAVAVGVFALAAGCSSGPNVPKQRTEILDWKGAGLGTPIPQWVVAAQEGNAAVQKMDAYKGEYCFVVSYDDDTNKDYATAWVDNSANGGQEVARIISTTVNSRADAKRAGKGGSGASRSQAGEQSTMSTEQAEERQSMNNASYVPLLLLFKVYHEE
jgi:hypothetical protein